MYNLRYNTVTTVYIVMLGFYSYFEMKFCLFFYTPLYLICVYVVSAAQVDKMAEIRTLLSSEHRDFLSDGVVSENMRWAILLSGALLLAKLQ